MSYRIPHCFQERLNSIEGLPSLRYIVIGTFNPGHPDRKLMSPQEAAAFEAHKSSNRKFRDNDEVLNFYDRSPNRWWGTCDRLLNEAYYQKHGLRKRRLDGLKYYKANPNRVATFTLQQEFCRTQGILITDLVSYIVATNLDAVYTNFADSVIDRLVPKDGWNTGAIIETIDRHRPEAVLFTFQSNSAQIPNISRQIARIAETGIPVRHLMSPSGSRAAKWEEIVEDYQLKMPLILT